MSQVLTNDTSTWSAMNSHAQNAAIRAARNSKDADDLFVAHYLAGRTDYRILTPGAVWGLPHAPGTALGLMPPSAMREFEKKKRDFFDAIKVGANLAIEMAIADEMDAPNFDLWKSASIRLIPFVGQVSAPLVHPLQLGGVSFEWHDAGLNIEIRFRGPQDIFVVIEDARGELPEFMGKDPWLSQAAPALFSLMARQS